MKKRIIIQALLIVSTSFCFGQVSYTNSAISDSKVSNSCYHAIENKTIGICKIKTDTLTYDQLKKCNKLTIGEDTKEVIVSYYIGYSPDTSRYVERSVESNQIPNDLITTIVDNQIKRIIINKTKGDDGTEKFDLGYRCFYIKF
jgi:hypothetical protein